MSAFSCSKKLINQIEKWFEKDIDGCPRHLLYPKSYLLWDWVLRPGANMGIKNYIHWLRRKN